MPHFDVKNEFVKIYLCGSGLQTPDAALELVELDVVGEDDDLEEENKRADVHEGRRFGVRNQLRMCSPVKDPDWWG